MQNLLIRGLRIVGLTAKADRLEAQLWVKSTLEPRLALRRERRPQRSAAARRGWKTRRGTA